MSSGELAAIAGSLGSDITFFLGSACAVASGRGTELAQVPAFKSDVLLVVPRETLPAKTSTMYRALVSSDFSPGSQVAEIVTRLVSGIGTGSTQLVNTFSRPLCSLIPRIGDLQQSLESLGNFAWALSGAGPAHYVLAPVADHRWITEALRSQFGDWLTFTSTSTRIDPISCEGGQP
jgi:4-diphosphocytidyl-2C-methyl-D-erythritol kinase